MTRSRADDVFNFTERSIAEDHARHVDAVDQPTDEPATPAPPDTSVTPNSGPRPAWSSNRRSI
jgi:hypothetical protein